METPPPTCLIPGLLADPVVSRHFVDVDLRGLKTHMRAFLAAVLGGAAGSTRGARWVRTTPTWESPRQDRDLTVGHLAVATQQTLGVPDDRIGGIGAWVLPPRDVIVTA